MKIGVISDTHGDTHGWQAAIAGPFVGVDLIIHAGDLLYHGPRNPRVAGYDPAALAQLINRAPAPVIIARGNCDSEVDQLVLDYPIQAPYALVVVEGARVMVNHGTEFGLEDPMPQIARVAEKYQADVFICGHTHLALLQRVGGALVMNPGSPSLPKSRSGTPQSTVGIIENGIARIMVLDGAAIAEARIERRGAA